MKNYENYAYSEAISYPCTNKEIVSLNDAGQKWKGEESMSLVGIMQTDNGLIAFGDSKGTVHDSQNNCYEDKNRTVQKVFVGKNFLLTTFGNNTCIVDDKKVNLEDVLKMLLVKCNADISLFFLRLNEKIKNTYEIYPNLSYSFIVGCRNDEEKYIQEVELSKDNIKYNEKIYTTNMIHCITPCCPNHLTPLQTWSLEESIKYAELLVQNTIQLGDIFLAYNPVGGDIYIATMDNKGNIKTYINGKQQPFKIM